MNFSSRLRPEANHVQWLGFGAHSNSSVVLNLFRSFCSICHPVFATGHVTTGSGYCLGSLSPDRFPIACRGGLEYHINANCWRQSTNFCIYKGDVPHLVAKSSLLYIYKWFYSFLFSPVYNMPASLFTPRLLLHANMSTLCDDHAMWTLYLHSSRNLSPQGGYVPSRHHKCYIWTIQVN